MRSRASLSFLVIVLILVPLAQTFQVDHTSFLYNPAKKVGCSIKNYSTLRPGSVLRNDNNQPWPNSSDNKNNGVSVSKKDSPQQLGNDSVERFSNDVRKVLKELRPSDEDPEVPGTSIAHTKSGFLSVWKKNEGSFSHDIVPSLIAPFFPD
jgi:hypothetical protein